MTEKGYKSKVVRKKKPGSKVDKLISFFESKIYDEAVSSKPKAVKKKTAAKMKKAATVAKKSTKAAAKTKKIAKKKVTSAPKKLKKTVSKPKTAAKKKIVKAAIVAKKLTKAEQKAAEKKRIEGLIQFTQKKIHAYAKRITETPDRADRSAMGELNFYVALRNVLKFSNLSPTSKDARDRPSYRDFGMVDAANSTLRHLGIITTQKGKFYDHGATKSITPVVEKSTKAQEKAKIEGLIQFTQEKVHAYAKRIIETPDRADRSAMGELNFYVALRNVLKFSNLSPTSKDPRDRPSYRDFGLVGAVNDTLRHLGVVTVRKGNFYD